MKLNTIILRSFWLWNVDIVLSWENDLWNVKKWTSFIASHGGDTPVWMSHPFLIRIFFSKWMVNIITFHPNISYQMDTFFFEKGQPDGYFFFFVNNQTDTSFLTYWYFGIYNVSNWFTKYFIKIQIFISHYLFLSLLSFSFLCNFFWRIFFVIQNLLTSTAYMHLILFNSHNSISLSDMSLCWSRKYKMQCNLEFVVTQKQKSILLIIYV